MADNYSSTSGVVSDGTYAADEVTIDGATVKLPRAKLTFGVAGSAVDVSGTNPLPGTLTFLELAEDAAHVSGDRGIMALTVRKDTAAATAGTDGDYQPLVTDANGRAHTNPVGSITAADGSTLTSTIKGFSLGGLYNGTTEDLARSVVNSTNSTGTGIAAVGLLAQYDDTAPSVVTENQFANLRMSSGRWLYVSPITGQDGVDGNAGATSAKTLRNVPASDARHIVNQDMVTASFNFARPANTTVYTPQGKAMSDSTSSPTTGGYTLSNVASANGGHVQLLNVRVWLDSAPTTTQSANLELWFADSAITNINDGAAFAVTDAENRTVKAKAGVGCITVGNNQQGVVACNDVFKCAAGSRDLRVLIRVANDYTPGSAENVYVECTFARLT